MRQTRWPMLPCPVGAFTRHLDRTRADASRAYRTGPAGVRACGAGVASAATIADPPAGMARLIVTAPLAWSGAYGPGARVRAAFAVGIA